jgi:hypothetical protein
MPAQLSSPSLSSPTTLTTTSARVLVEPSVDAQSSTPSLPSTTPTTTTTAPRVLVIGLGGGALPNFIARHWAHAQLECVEIDRRVARAACVFFGLRVDEQSQRELGLADIGLAGSNKLRLNVKSGSDHPARGERSEADSDEFETQLWRSAAFSLGPHAGFAADEALGGSDPGADCIPSVTTSESASSSTSSCDPRAACRVHCVDAAEFVAAAAADSFDIVFVDVYTSAVFPPALLNARFFAHLRRICRRRQVPLPTAGTPNQSLLDSAHDNDGGGSVLINAGVGADCAAVLAHMQTAFGDANEDVSYDSTIKHCLNTALVLDAAVAHAKFVKTATRSDVPSRDDGGNDDSDSPAVAATGDATENGIVVGGGIVCALRRLAAVAQSASSGLLSASTSNQNDHDDEFEIVSADADPSESPPASSSASASSPPSSSIYSRPTHAALAHWRSLAHALSADAQPCPFELQTLVNDNKDRGLTVPNSSSIPSKAGEAAEAQNRPAAEQYHIGWRGVDVNAEYRNAQRRRRLRLQQVQRAQAAAADAASSVSDSRADSMSARSGSVDLAAASSTTNTNAIAGTAASPPSNAAADAMWSLFD